MKKNITYIILLSILILSGCTKVHDINILEVLTSKSWEQVDSYNGEDLIIKTFEKVTFDGNGKYEFITRNWGININGDTNEFIILTGDYDYISIENKIVFESSKHILLDTIHGCDTLQQYIADWHINKINEGFLEVQGEFPDTTNHATCYSIFFNGKYPFEPFLEE